MTVEQKIKQMTLDELVEFILDEKDFLYGDCNDCQFVYECENDDSDGRCLQAKDNTRKYLKSEIK